MSIGYGRIEQALLSEIAQAGQAIISEPGASRSMTESRRRAAKRLADEGVVGITRVLIGGRSRTVVMSKDAALEHNQQLVMKKVRELRVAHERCRMEMADFGLNPDDL